MRYNYVFALIFLLLIITCTPKEQTTRNPADSLTIKTPSEKGTILFLSTQLNPIKEADELRHDILKDFDGGVIFKPTDNSLLYEILNMEIKSNPDRNFLVGGLHGDLQALKKENSLIPLNNIFGNLKNRHFIKEFVRLGKFNTASSYYIPWMQATYLMAANKKALKYLPAGANINKLTYNDLILWGRNIYKDTGVQRIGFPLGKNGLMHRFFQGYLYPSYTGSTLKKFRSPEAVSMWKDFKELWEYVSPSSLAYSSMSQPLMTGDIWIAWDHSARLIRALKTEPENFVVFPAPAGPAGRGYMVALSGLAVPRNSGMTKNAFKLIEYLTRPDIQVITLNKTGFFPVVDYPEKEVDSESLKQLGKAIYLQSSSPEGITTLLPMGLGESGDNFNSQYLLAFSGIILEQKDIISTLNRIKKRLQEIIDRTGAVCWPPDVPDGVPCQLE